MSMPCKESNSAGINDLNLLKSPAPACGPTSPKDTSGAGRSEDALPAALAASGIPRIVVLDENAVYDHYMRRLNRVWMKRIKVYILVSGMRFVFPCEPRSLLVQLRPMRSSCRT